tara:strand:- start:1273 stop:2004 length:732 start_codon:yes stop_codon:yes gene_type:complete
MRFSPGSYLVAGSTGAIGQALVRTLIAGGARPVLFGRNADALAAQSIELGGLDYRVADLCNPEEVGPALADLPADLKGVAYAAGSVTLKPLRSATPADFATSLALNAISAAETIKAATPALKKNQGSVVLFSSVAVQSGFSNHAVISASKGAVEGLTRALSAELAPHVRVNCVAPSLTHTSAMSTPLTSNEKTAAAIAAAHAIPRLGAPEDSSELAAFLLSESATWMTGQVIGVDGGRSVVLR